MTPEEALVHAMEALDEAIVEDAEALRVLRRLFDWVIAQGEDFDLDE